MRPRCACPREFSTIQTAIQAAAKGDTIMVAAGTYRERLTLKPGIIVRSEGDDTKGKTGLKRAEATILDGSVGSGAGVEMALEATLDGFTITGVGKYDDALWQHHFDTQGNEQPHEHIGAARRARHLGHERLHRAAQYRPSHRLHRHRHHRARDKVAPRIAGNVCFRNMGGGIGSMKGSTALIEGNICFENFYAGIGCDASSPVVKDNVCHGNIRAGIGISEGSSPTVTGNRCFKNRRAGIGIRTGKDTRPVVEGNECSENDMAGIGVEEGARPLIVKNRIIGNKLVAIGVTGDSEATIKDNELARDGGVPPMIAVLDGSRAVITGNTIRGGGVAGILVKGSAEIRGNHFFGNAPGTKPASNNAVWAHRDSEVVFIGNHFEHWQHALSATGAGKSW